MDAGGGIDSSDVLDNRPSSVADNEEAQEYERDRGGGQYNENDSNINHEENPSAAAAVDEAANSYSSNYMQILGWNMEWASKHSGDRLMLAAEVILNNYFLINLNGSQRWRRIYIYQIKIASPKGKGTAISIKISDLINLFKINPFYHSDILAALVIRFYPLVYESFISRKRALIGKKIF